ncbi:uncharacterized protein [Ptychodera flava]|uniref:uncharacterized protein n=1 Tax=Ptychodera flava TaxID=63121 RepID=UPI00396A80FB
MSKAEGDTTGFRSRKRKSTRRSSSILKAAKSPTRSALGDLDSNVLSENNPDGEEVKKQRRISRRVSFAETHQVKEFVNADAIGILRDAEEHERTAQKVDECANRPKVSNQGVEIFCDDEIQQHAPPIQGLESLLSGTIKTHIALSNLCQESAVDNRGYNATSNVNHQLQENSRCEATSVTTVSDIRPTNQHGGTTESHFNGQHVLQQQQDNADRSQHFTQGVSEQSGSKVIDSSLFLKKFLDSGVKDTGRDDPGITGANVPQNEYTGSNDRTILCDPGCDGDMELTGCHDADNFVPDKPLLCSEVPASNVSRISSLNNVSNAAVTSYHGSNQYCTQSISQHDSSSVNQASMKMFDGKSFLHKFSSNSSMFDMPSAPSNLNQTEYGNQQSDSTKPYEDDVDKTIYFENIDMEETRRMDRTMYVTEADTEVSFRPTHRDGHLSAEGNKEPQTTADHTMRLDQTMDLTMRTENFLVNKSACTNILESTDAILSSLDDEIQRRSSHSVNGGTYRNDTANETRVFNAGEDTAHMELTVPTGRIMYQQIYGVADGKKHNLKDDGDKTRVFNSGEDTGHMELTMHTGRIIYQSNSKTVDIRKNKSHDVDDDRTRCFNAGEDTAHMDLTMPTGKIIYQQSSGVVIGKEKSCDVDDNKTRIFNCNDDTGHMDLTMNTSRIVDQENINIVSGKEHSNDVNDEKTRIFNSGEDTAFMDLTVPSGKILCQENSDIRMRKQSHNENEDRTRVFNSGDDTAHMELTMHTGRILCQENSDAVRFHQKQGSLVDGDRTRVFTKNDNSGHMEFTECITGHDRQPQQTKPCDSPEGMEMTKCVTSNISLHRNSFPSVHTGESLANNRGESELDNEKTKIFNSEDTARMELTMQTGGITYQSSAYDSNDDKTRMVQQDDNTGQMELTTCVGGLHQDVSNTNSGTEKNESRKDFLARRLSQIPATREDQTRVFNADDQTAAMDFTTCNGGLLPSVVVGSNSRTGKWRSKDEQTKIFGSADDMEMTTHMTSNISIHADSLPGMQKERVKNRQSAGDPEQADKTRIFTSEETAQMELTAHTGKIISFNHRGDSSLRSSLPSVKSGVSTSASISTNKTDLATCNNEYKESKQGTGSDNSSSLETETKEGREITTGAENERGDSMADTNIDEDFKVEDQASEKQTASVECGDKTTLSNAEIPDNETNKRDSDTFVVNHSSDDSGTFVISKKLKTSAVNESRLDDTFTVEPTDDLKSPQQKEPTGQEKDQLLDGMDGILEEKPMDFEDITDHGAYHRGDATKTLDASRTILHISSMSGGECSKSDIAISIVDDDSTTEKKALSADGKLDVADFLEYFCIFPKQKEGGRRSTLAPVSIKPLESLKDYLEIICLIQPQHEMYEWAIDHLKDHTNKLLGMLTEQEGKLSENNPPIFDEIRRLPPEELGKVRTKLKTLVHACNKTAKLKWSEWKAKMNSKILDALKEEHTSLSQQVKSVEQSVDSADKALEDLKIVEIDLDKALSGLEYPADFNEKLTLHKDISNEVKLKQMELDGLRDNLEIMKKKQTGETDRKEGFLKELEEIEKTEDDLKNSCVSNAEVNTAFDKVKLLQRFLEWQLEDWNQYGAKYSFLESSIHLGLTFGRKHGDSLYNGLPDCDIVNVELESMLAADAMPCAKFAHRMVCNALNAASLQQKYHTTKKLPQLLHHVSSVVCNVRQLINEMDHIMFWHQVEINDTCVSVAFSNWITKCKFIVSFYLLPGQYPSSAVQHSFVNVIGNISEETLATTLSAVKPGFKYLTSLVNSIELLLEKK